MATHSSKNPAQAVVTQEPSRSAVEEMDRYLATVAFPTSADAYEFPDLELPATNPNAATVKAARVKRDWSSVEPRPDFLTTRLDEPVVTLSEFRWDTDRKRLSRGNYPIGGALLDLAAEDASYTSLVSVIPRRKTDPPPR